MHSAEECSELEHEVYNTLKYYVRLMKEYPRTKNMLITSSARRIDPQRAAKWEMISDAVHLFFSKHDTNGAATGGPAAAADHLRVQEARG